MTCVCIVTLTIVALGAITASVLEYHRVKREKQMCEEFKIDISH